MRHHETCTAWAEFHPYDCPWCNTFGHLTMLTDAEIQDLEDRAYEDGKLESEQEIENMRSRISDVIMDLEAI